MKKQGWILIGITAAFFCLLFGVFLGRSANKSYIQIQDIQSAPTQPTESQPPAAPVKINVNTATVKQLQLLDGIGLRHRSYSSSSQFPRPKRRMSFAITWSFSVSWMYHSFRSMSPSSSLCR